MTLCLAHLSSCPSAPQYHAPHRSPQTHPELANFVLTPPPSARSSPQDSPTLPVQLEGHPPRGASPRVSLAPIPLPWLAPGTAATCATSRLWTTQHRGVHAAGVQENSILLTKYHFEKDRRDDLSQDDCIWSLRKQHPSKSHFKKVN